MNESDLRVLLTTDGLAAVAMASASPLDSIGGVSGATALLRKKGYSPEVTAAALTQARLRSRATAKFGEFANDMLFTETGLQQATRLKVAALHAGRFRDAGIGRVADLGCGIGADSLAIASLNIHVTAVDADPITAAIAAYNLAPFPNANVAAADAREVDLADVDGVFCDPARRETTSGEMRRLYDPTTFEPPLDWVFSLASTHPLGVKLGPGHPHDAIPEGCEALWISDGGTAVELGLWFGPLATPGRRFGALVLSPAGPEWIEGHEHEEPVPVGIVGRFLYDPDPAVIRARALGTLAGMVDATSISDGIAYLSSDRSIDTPFAARFAITDVLPFDRKKLRSLLRERGVGILEIKKRGADIDPAQLRRELSLRGEESATLIVTRIGGRHRAILAKRC